MSKPFKALAPVAPSKAERQAFYHQKVKDSGLSNQVAARQAELTPADVERQFRLIAWHR
ncbi:hypothetical protein [Sulfurirhabdus autotrophica]|uniref:Uncharacterized protein n=1 Tax=Sulfurirhabdus autotrophica TaxID=1706046 RepID=A0A4V6P3S2_9PROT|nr:hypothetical protein [Sulfurirhabdus autotrophica]TCV81075.1 hypothetical protein EDC63_12733 [Sulfurirhabdus autotrophica]